MSIFTNPSKILDNVIEWLHGETKDVLEFISPVVKMLERDGRKALIAAATAAVAHMATTDLSSGDKREEALKMISSTLLAAGLAFVESEARVVLEMAVQGLKAKDA